MRKELLRIMVFCAACLVLGAKGQNAASDPSAPGSPTVGSPGSSIGSPSSSQSSPSARYSATGRMGQQEVRASKLMGVQVKSSSGESLGTINDVILNPTSGRIDFAVISLGSSFSSSSTPGASDTASQSGQSSTLSATGGKLLAVPWNLLRSSGAIGYGATSGGGQTTASSSISGQQQTFVFTGDKSKLQAAPSFDQSNWPDMSGSWRQSIHSYYGVQQDSSTGAASSPGGVGSSSGTSSSSSTIPSSSDSPSKDSSSTPDSSSTGKP